MEIEERSNRRSSGSSFCIKKISTSMYGQKKKHFHHNMEWSGQGGCKIGFPNSHLKYSPWSADVDGSIESIHQSQFYSEDPKIEQPKSPRCDGLNPLVQDPNQAKNMPQNYFTKPTMWLLLWVQVEVHCHPKDRPNIAYKIWGRYPKSHRFLPYSETTRNGYY